MVTAGRDLISSVTQLGFILHEQHSIVLLLLEQQFNYTVHSTKFALEGLSESMSYELEPFGIRIVLIEPGFVRTNIMNSSIIAKKAQDPKSPYSSLIQQLERSFKSAMENVSASSPPEEVAKVVLQAITSESPKLRYAVGNDAANMIKAKTTMSDTEFGGLIKQQFQS